MDFFSHPHPSTNLSTHVHMGIGGILQQSVPSVNVGLWDALESPDSTRFQQVFHSSLPGSHPTQCIPIAMWGQRQVCTRNTQRTVSFAPQPQPREAPNLCCHEPWSPPSATDPDLARKSWQHDLRINILVNLGMFQWNLGPRGAEASRVDAWIQALDYFAQQPLLDNGHKWCSGPAVIAGPLRGPFPSPVGQSYREELCPQEWERYICKACRMRKVFLGLATSSVRLVWGAGVFQDVGRTMQLNTEDRTHFRQLWASLAKLVKEESSPKGRSSS